MLSLKFTKLALFICGVFYVQSAPCAYADYVNAGSKVTLSATADGTPPFTYQWQKDGVGISGAIGSNYIISNMQNANAGSYSVVVTNELGSVISAKAILDVQTGSSTALSITPILDVPSTEGWLSSQIATAGHEVTFIAVGTNGAGQWQVSSDGSTWSNLANNSTYSGVTTSALVIGNVTVGLSGQKYRFVSQGSAGDSVSLTVVPAFFPFPVGIVADGAGNLYVSDTSTDTIQKISSASVVKLWAGSSGQTGTADGSSTNARFNDPSGLSAAYDGTLSISDSSNGTLRRVTTTGTVSTLAGSASNRGNVDGNSLAATFSSPFGISQDSSGNLYVADAINNTIRKITSAGTVSTLAGSAGVAGSVDGVGSTARFNHPTGIAVDNVGNVYVSDSMNNVIRKITSSGAVTTLAGLAGVNGAQDGLGSQALFNNPGGLAVDRVGNVYLADSGNSIVRKIEPSGLVSTIAGLPGIAGLRDGTGSNAWFNQPKSVALDYSGVLYVADTGNAAIRRVTMAGVVSTLALTADAKANPPSSSSEGSPSPNSVPSLNTVSSSATTSSGGSGSGGGAMNGWFALTLILIGLRRWCLLEAK